MTECCSMLKPELWDILGLAGLILRSSNNPLRHHRARCSAWNFCSSTLRREAQNQRMESGDLGTLGWRRRDIAVLPFHTFSHSGGTSLFTGLTCKRAVGPRCHEVDFDHPHDFDVFYPLLGA